MKDKLKSLKNPPKDVPTHHQKQVGGAACSKSKSTKVTAVVSLLNNTMPMPKLMIDLAAPSTGGSTDIVNNESAEALFKNNLARVAKNQR